MAVDSPPSSVRHSWQITAIPTTCASGVAPLLVALGDAGIVVTRAQTKYYQDMEAYVLTVDQPAKAMSVLQAMGCHIQRLSPGTEDNAIVELVTFASEIRIRSI